MTDTSQALPPAPFWRALLSGPDNQTPAIGRVFGALVGLLLVVNLLVGLPAVVCTVLLLQHVAPETWFAFMGALTPYITAGSLAIGGLVGGLIAGTAFTEPREHP